MVKLKVRVLTTHGIDSVGTSDIDINPEKVISIVSASNNIYIFYREDEEPPEKEETDHSYHVA